MSRSVERTDLFGNRYVQHYDDAGRKIGRSVFYGDHTRHYDKSGKETGRTYKAGGIVEPEYEQHYDSLGREDGSSVGKTGLFGGEFTQHYDKFGRDAGQSHEHDGTIEHEGPEAEAPRPLLRPIEPPPPPPPSPRVRRPPIRESDEDASDFGAFARSMMVLIIAVIAAVVFAIWRYRHVRVLFFFYVALVLQLGIFASLASQTHFVVAAFVAAAVALLLYRFCFSTWRWRAADGPRINAWVASGIMATVTLVAYLVIGIAQPAFVANPVGTLRQTISGEEERTTVRSAQQSDVASSEVTTPATTPTSTEPPEQNTAAVVADATPPDQAAADDRAYAVARATDTSDAYAAYLSSYPTGRHVQEAQRASQALIKPTYPPYDLAQLNPQVRDAVMRAREAESRANIAGLRARQAAERAEAAAIRARNGEPGSRVVTQSAPRQGRTRSEVEWSSGTANGYGVQTVIAGAYMLGDRYAGEWRDGHLSGVGVITLEPNQANTGNQLRYEGEFMNDNENGVGIIYWRTGEHYAGEIRASSVGGGGGVLYFPDGHRHEGEYAGGASNGFGVLWDSQGHVLQQGIWRNGNFSAPLAP